MGEEGRIFPLRGLVSSHFPLWHAFLFNLPVVAEATLKCSQTIRFRDGFKVLMIAYKALNGLGPQYLADRLLPPRSTQITRHSQQGRLRGLTPREARKEKTRNRAFSAVPPRLWNTLPTEIRLAPSLGVFKSQLKTWLFKQAFPPVN